MKHQKWCANRIIEEFSKLQDKHKYEIISCSNVKNAKDKMEIKCLTCNTIFSSTCNNFFNIGTRCSVCSYKTFTKEIVIHKFNELEDRNNFLLVAVPDNCNSKSKITVNCNICNKNFYPSVWDFFYHKTRCPFCLGLNTWDSIRVYKEFDNTLDKNLYRIIDATTVTSRTSKFDIECLTCGNIWKTTPLNYFVSKRRCPICKSSSGERLIFCYLKSKNINFEVEKTFPGLTLKKNLRFDFYLPSYNLIIEFHGQHHFHKIDGLKITEKQVILNREKDNFKRNFVLSMGMNFLEIHYDEIRWTYHIIEAYLKNLVSLEV